MMHFRSKLTAGHILSKSCSWEQKQGLAQHCTPCSSIGKFLTLLPGLAPAEIYPSISINNDNLTHI